MRRFERQPTPLVDLALATSFVAVFLLDLNTRLGVAVWALYAAPIAIAFMGWRPLLPILAAGAATVLTVAGAFLSAPGAEPSLALTNRSIGVAADWVLGALGWRFVGAKLAVARQDWLAAGEAAAAKAMRGDLTTAQLADAVLRSVAKTLAAVVGAFYEVRDGRLERIAAWASETAPGAAVSFAIGEGLVGEAARENRLLKLAPATDEHLVVAGGVVPRLRPRTLLVAPLEAGGVVRGVLELGFAGSTGGADEALLAAIAEPVGVALVSAQYRSRLQQLLEQTQRQAAELEAQREELRVANEELHEQTESLRDAQARLEVQHGELEETNVELEAQKQALEQRGRELEDAQRELEVKAQQLDRANRYKSEFLANMSHELRTPLNSSLILSRLLADNREGNLTEEQVKHARTIHDAGNDLLALINDILDLSKIEAGRMEVHPEPVQPARVLEQISAAFQAPARQKGLALEFEVARGTPAAIETDRQRLSQILQNLVSNAVKFTPAGGVIVSAAPAAPGRVAFAVRDTGIGIAEEQQALVFEAFRQAESTTNRRFGGTGLGLSISRELARLLGGEIRLESRLGAGSTFTLELPVAWPGARDEAAGDRRASVQGITEERTEDTAPGGCAAPPLAHEGQRRLATPATGAGAGATPRLADARSVLIVEDDPAFAEIVAGLARERGFEPVVAGSGEQALRAVRERQPTAIVLDVLLPDCNGLTLLDELKRDPGTRHVPVHVVSATDHADVALDLGAVGYAVKPVEREDLVAAFAAIERRLSRSVRRILVVGGDAAQQESICGLLSGTEVECTCVAGMAEALRALEDGTWDCMVMDVTIPGGSGYDLLDRMAANERGGFPPVIVYASGELSREDEQRLRRYSRCIIVKGARSPERLLDEVNLFLHRVHADLSPEHQRMVSRARSREAAFEGRRILVVEDDVRNVFALASILEPRGATVEIARNGREAVQRLERKPPIDLVLMDIMMPEMDGYEAMRRIRALPEHGKLPIIALTARAMRDDRDRCIAAGASDYIAKPLDVDRLMSLMRVWMPR